MMARHFVGTDLDRTSSVDLIRALSQRHGVKVFDFGCSWGYGAWQLGAAGFDVQAWEISEARSLFAAQKLGVRLVSPENVEPESFDVVYSSHVIEHVPCPRDMLAQGLRMLRVGGVFLALTPNGSLRYRHLDREGWQKSWGEVHPQLICEEWIRNAAGSLPYFACSAPVNLSELAGWRNQQVVSDNLVKPHLMFAIRKC